MIKNVLILFLLAIILWMSKSFLAPSNLKPIETIKIDTFLIKKDTTIYKPGKNIVKDTTIYDTIPQLVQADTMAILKDYFAKNVYKDTITFAEGQVSLIDTISQNKIQGRRFNASVTQKIIKEVRELRIPYQPKGELFFGGAGMYGQDGTLGGAAGIMYKSPYKGVIQLNYTNSKQIQLGYYFKIF